MCIRDRPYSGGLTRNIVQCLHDYDIPLYLSHTVTDVRGHDRLEQVTVSRVDEQRMPIPGTEMVFECDTLLLSVGLIPENELTRQAGICMDGDVYKRQAGAICVNGHDHIAALGKLHAVQVLHLGRVVIALSLIHI